MGDTFDAHKTEIIESIKPIESQFNVVSMSLEDIDTQLKELHDHQAASKASKSRWVTELQGI